MMKKLTIATRTSPLALWQANYIRQCLQKQHPELEVNLLELTTRGDKILDAPLAKVGGKGLFVKELEHALLEGQADIAVHSIKDVPMELPEGLKLAVLCRREDPRDCLISKKYSSLEQLPIGARVGTSSLRRKSQLAALRSDLNFVDIRGNIHTRLAHLDNASVDAVVLAVAGLVRMELAEQISQSFSMASILPAVGQGALGLEIRAEDAEVMELIAHLHHAVTGLCVTAERAMNRRLNGGCQVPIAGYAVLEHSHLYLRGLVGSVDGRTLLRAESKITLMPNYDVAMEQADHLGVMVAQQLLDQGAQALLQAVEL